MMRVSVIIPVFNGAATIADAIRSALDQQFDDAREIIVVDDGSTDRTAELLAAYGDRIVTVGQPNRGLAAARNAGAARAAGEYLAFLDADDAWLPEKLALMIPRLDENPQSVLAYSDILPVDQQGRPLGRSPISPDFAHAPSMEELLRQWWPILPSTVVMRRRALAQTGGFCDQFRRAYEDVEMWLRARALGPFEFIGTPLVRYCTTPIDERMARYEDDYAVFARRLRERYGARSHELLRATRRAYASSLGHRGLIAMRAGNPAAAREYFGRALRYRSNARNLLRWIRTFLPPRWAHALSGRSAKLEESWPR